MKQDKKKSIATFIKCILYKNELIILNKSVKIIREKKKMRFKNDSELIKNRNLTKKVVVTKICYLT